MVAQFTAKTINSEKHIYVLSLMSSSTNKLKSHMLLTCKNFMFSDFTRETPEINDGDWKYKIVDIARISKYKNIFAEGNVPNWSKEAFVIKKLKSNEPYIITDFKSKKLVGTFYKKGLQKTN